MALFYHTGALGDFLLSLPFLRALRRAFPIASWTLVSKEEHARLASRIFPHERRGVPGLAEFAPLARGEPDREELAAFLDRHGPIFGFARGAAILEAAAIGLRPELRVVLAEPLARTTSLGEEIEATLDAVLSRIEPRRHPVGPTDFEIARGELPPLGDTLSCGLRRTSSTWELPGAGARTALIYVGASDVRRMPPGDLLRDIASGLEGLGYRILWARGPIEVERGLEAPTGESFDAPDASALAHAIAASRLYVGGNGPAHLASALGVPTIALHGSPDPLWRPRGSRAQLLGGTGGFPCASEVVAAAMEVAGSP